MTGYGKAEGFNDVGSWSWEVKSVNGRGLDIRCRLGSGMERLESVVREKVAAAMKRGSVTVSLKFFIDPSQKTVTVNRELVEQILNAAKDIAGEAGSKPSLDAIFGVPGVVQISTITENLDQGGTLDLELLKDLDKALNMLRKSGCIEGKKIAEICSSHLGEIKTIINSLATAAEVQPERIRDRLAEKISSVLDDDRIPEDRLAQEVALLSIKTDVREELDRLKTHRDAAESLLANGGEVGRMLDFLSQELSREANTLCAKSSDVDLSKSGLKLKAVIDRLREQAQNLE